MSDCCAGRGFVLLHLVGEHEAHWRRKGERGFAIVETVDDVRVACICRAGDVWYDARMKLRDVTAEQIAAVLAAEKEERESRRRIRRRPAEPEA